MARLGRPEAEGPAGGADPRRTPGGEGTDPAGRAARPDRGERSGRGPLGGGRADRAPGPVRGPPARDVRDRGGLPPGRPRGADPRRPGRANVRRCWPASGPKEIGPDEGPIVSDLRAFLLEVASEPPRLRQDGALFQKEVDRFRATLEPLPSWLLGLLRWSDEGRLSQALAWSRRTRTDGDRLRGDAGPAPAHVQGASVALERP